MRRHLAITVLLLAACSDATRSDDEAQQVGPGGALPEGRDAAQVGPAADAGGDAGDVFDDDGPVERDAGEATEDATADAGADAAAGRADASDPSQPDARLPGIDASPPAPDAADPGPDPDAAPQAVCGDGVRAVGEACDDGNRMAGDYCAADCAAITGRCGDGIRQPNESCDDGIIAAECLTWHDGGDGTCVAPGTCLDGYVLEGGDCVPLEANPTIDIFVDNFCGMQVVPPSFDVPLGRTALFTFANRSRDYEVNVWMSYGGGFLDLPIGQSWADPIDHCVGPRRPRQEWADISTACSNHRFVIFCRD